MKSSILSVIFMMLLLFISDIGSANESEEKEEKLVVAIQSKTYKGACRDAKCRSTCVSEGYKDGACFSIRTIKFCLCSKKKFCVCSDLPSASGKKILVI
ncbi:hypothetical protein ABFX02_11G099600 [Erythranthe guttata]